MAYLPNGLIGKSLLPYCLAENQWLPIYIPVSISCLATHPLVLSLTWLLSCYFSVHISWELYQQVNKETDGLASQQVGSRENSLFITGALVHEHQGTRKNSSAEKLSFSPTCIMHIPHISYTVPITMQVAWWVGKEKAGRQKGWRRKQIVKRMGTRVGIGVAVVRINHIPGRVGKQMAGPKQ